MSRSSWAATAGACDLGDMLAPMSRVLVLACALAAAACGPITYLGEVTRGAQTAVDQARAQQADKYAPYYWTRAVNYLRAAREEAARADFQGANHFGRLAREAAELAANEASTADRKGGEVAPAKDGGEPAPAKKLAPAKDAP